MTPVVRVFARNDASPAPAEIAQALGAPGESPQVEEDAQGWFACTLHVEASPYCVERFLREEDGIVGQLQGWAAWAESRSTTPRHDELTALLATARQVFVIHHDQGAEELITALAQRLARETVGAYYVEGLGFFNESGELLLQE